MNPKLPDPVQLKGDDPTPQLTPPEPLYLGTLVGTPINRKTVDTWNRPYPALY